MRFPTLALPLLLLPLTPLAQTIRYMPFGDSITEFGCWRAYLHQRLAAASYTLDFVGSMTSSTACSGINYDRNHEGHAGFQAVNIANQNQLVGWLQQNPADIVTVHLGTNDVFGGRSTQDIITALGKMVEQMRQANARMKIIVAQIIPLSFNNNPIVQLNAAIPEFVRSRNTTQSQIWLVDQYTGFTTGDLGDGVHPNDAGDRKLTEKWYPAVVEAIEAVKRDRAEGKVEFKA